LLHILSIFLNGRIGLQLLVRPSAVESPWAHRDAIWAPTSTASPSIVNESGAQPGGRCGERRKRCTAPSISSGSGITDVTPASFGGVYGALYHGCYAYNHCTHRCRVDTFHSPTSIGTIVSTPMPLSRQRRALHPGRPIRYLRVLSSPSAGSGTSDLRSTAVNCKSEVTTSRFPDPFSASRLFGAPGPRLPRPWLDKHLGEAR
jgi:hypothetical protein